MMTMYLTILRSINYFNKDDRRLHSMLGVFFPKILPFDHITL